jgi:aminopeptidase N
VIADKMKTSARVVEHSLVNANNNMINIEKLSDEESQVLATQFEQIRARRKDCTRRQPAR